MTMIQAIDLAKSVLHRLMMPKMSLELGRPRWHLSEPTRTGQQSAERAERERTAMLCLR